jgi:hypothetical protein
MKKNHPASTLVGPKVTEAEIRDYAQHLFEQSGRIPGRDLDNWLEAKACLEAHIPRHLTHLRLHRHRHPVPVDTVDVVTLDAEGIPIQETPPLSGNGADAGRAVVLGAPAP